MGIVYGYPIKSTWIKAIKAGNYMGWLLLTENNVAKYYPKTNETPKGHTNQTHKNVQSTKPKPAPLATTNTTSLQGKKIRDVYTKVYNIRETVVNKEPIYTYCSVDWSHTSIHLSM